MMPHLKNYEIFSSTDLDEVRASIKTLCSPHDFDVKGKQAAFDARVSAVQCGDLNLVHLTFGDVGIGVKAPEEDTDGLLLFLLTSGAGNLQHGTKEMDFSVEKGFFRDLAIPVNAREESFSSFMIPLSKEKLKAHAHTLLEGEADLMELAFDPEVDFTAPGGAVVRNTVHYMAEVLDGPLRELDNPIINTQMEDMLLTQILTLLPNSYQDVLSGRPIPTVVSCHIKRARDYIHAHADKNVGLSDIVAAAGCGYRRVQRGFMDAYGLSPMAYLRRIRLKRIRALLLTEQNEMTIHDVAKKWGFAHAGRFSQTYQREFGELPSETVHKRS